MTTAARDLALEQAARSLSIAKDRRLPRAVRDEAGEIASELVTAANQIGTKPRRMWIRRLAGAHDGHLRRHEVGQHLRLR